MYANYKTHWIKPFVQQTSQIRYSVDFADEVMADFLFIAGVRIDPDADDYAEMNSRQYFALIKQLPSYEGSVRRRFIREAEFAKRKKAAQLAGMKKPNGDFNWSLLANKAKARLAGEGGLEQGSAPITIEGGD